MGAGRSGHALPLPTSLLTAGPACELTTFSTLAFTMIRNKKGTGGSSFPTNLILRLPQALAAQASAMNGHPLLAFPGLP